MRTIESEVRALLKAIAADPRQVYAPIRDGQSCESPVCVILTRLEDRVVGAKPRSASNGSDKPHP